MMDTRLGAYIRLVRLDRPIGIWLLMWPSLWALWFAAQGRPDGSVLAVFVAGTLLMRSAGCAINDFADREIDPQVERTRGRPLATGALQPRDALLVFAALSLCALALVLTLNRLTVLLAIPAALLAASYPFAKRYTHLPQAHLGVAFGWGVPMAFAAVQNAVPLAAWALFGITLLWTVVYDTFYAMVDRRDDLKIGVKSSAILLGRHDRAVTALLQFLVVLGLAGLGVVFERGVGYFGGVLLAAGLAGYQQYLIRDRRPDACFQAFLNNHYFGMLIFVGLLLDYGWF